MRLTLCTGFFIAGAASAVPRSITINGDRFVDTNGATVLLDGSNVVVKGAPWLPDVGGNQTCGGDPGCRTFSEADARHFRRMGWNFLRLGVIWAGAQPTPEPKLDEEYVAKLRAILDLCHAHGIHVLLDLHEDAVSSAVCGEGMPYWFYQKSQPFGITGTPLVPQIRWPYTGTCGPRDFSSWMKYAGQEDYNIKNPCCKQFNQDGWARLYTTVQAQAAMAYLFSRKGRSEYARFTGLLAAAVQDHPAAFAIELMNEPPALQRAPMYDTWMECYKAIRAEVPDMSVGIVDTGSVPVSTGTLGLSNESTAWIRTGCQGCWYAFHYYSPPSGSAGEAVGLAVAQQRALGGMPAILTETMDCQAMQLAKRAGMGAAHWHYSAYCDDGFGACITGWADGNPNGCGNSTPVSSVSESMVQILL